MKKHTKIFALILSIVFLFAFCGCKKTEENPYSGWTIVEERINGVGDQLQYYAIFRITTSDSNRKLKDIWINAKNCTDDVINFEFAFSNASSMTSSYEVGASASKQFLAENDGWVKVIENATDIEYSYIEVYVTQNMDFNEIVLISTTDKTLTLTLVETGERPNRGSNSYKYKYSQNELEAKIEAGEITSSALDVIDKNPELKLEQ